MSARNLLDDLLDAWHRNNTILVNLLRAMPDGTMELRAAPGSMSVRELFVHMYYCRMLFAQQVAPELASPFRDGDWRAETDRDALAAMLDDSAAVLAKVVVGRLEAGRPLDTHYDHPTLFFHHFVWHEGYHHGQIKLALKLAGQPFDDEEIGRQTWDVWMEKAADRDARLKRLG